VGLGRGDAQHAQVRSTWARRSTSATRTVGAARNEREHLRVAAPALPKGTDLSRHSADKLAPSPRRSTVVLARRSAARLRPKLSTVTYSRSTNAPLRRPLELGAQVGLAESIRAGVRFGFSLSSGAASRNRRSRGPAPYKTRRPPDYSSLGRKTGAYESLVQRSSLMASPRNERTWRVNRRQRRAR
jgi:hypothetical protein